MDMFADANGYRSHDGHTMRREQGKTTNGNSFGGRWVLRSPSGEFIDINQYRHDLACHYDIELIGDPDD